MGTVDYYSHYAGIAVGDYVERYIRGNPKEMDRIRRTVDLVPEDVRTLLDVGAGHGVFLEELKTSRNIAAVGIEITPEKVEYGLARGVDMRLGDVSKLPFSNAAFDAVVACEVLEHLPYGIYEKALVELARVARRWLIVTVPYDEVRMQVRCPYCSAAVDPNYHFRSFAPGSLAKLFPGFSLVRETGLGEKHVLFASFLFGPRFRTWPIFLVCPSCGYHRDKETAGLAKPANPLVKAFAKRFLARRQPTWLVGAYKKESGG